MAGDEGTEDPGTIGSWTRGDTWKSSGVRATTSSDRQVLLLSAGALALSITFLHDIAPCPKAWTVWFLGAGWIGLVAAIVATVLSFRASSEAFLQQIRESDELYRTSKSPIVNEAAVLRTRMLTRIAAAGFGVGLSCLALFAVFNSTFKPGGHHGPEDAATEHTSAASSPAASANDSTQAGTGRTEGVPGEEGR